MTNKRRLGNHNVPSFKELYLEYYDDMKGASGLGPLDNEPDPDLFDPRAAARMVYIEKLEEVIDKQFRDNSFDFDPDEKDEFVNSLKGNNFNGKLVAESDGDPPIYVFTKNKDPRVVKFYFSDAGGTALNYVVAEDTSRPNQRLLWNKTAPSPQYTDTVADIISFMGGHRPGLSQSFSENKDR